MTAFDQEIISICGRAISDFRTVVLEAQMLQTFRTCHAFNTCEIFLATEIRLKGFFNEYDYIACINRIQCHLLQCSVS